MSSTVLSSKARGRFEGELLVEPSYLELQKVEDTPQGHARRRYWKHCLQSFDDDVIEAILLRGTTTGTEAGIASLLPNVSLQAYGGAIVDVPDETIYDPDNVFHLNQNIQPRARQLS